MMRQQQQQQQLHKEPDGAKEAPKELQKQMDKATERERLAEEATKLSEAKAEELAQAAVAASRRGAPSASDH